MLLSVAGFTVMGLVLRGAREDLGPFSAVFWRSAIGFLMLLAWAVPRREPLVGSRENRPTLLLRGLSGGMSLACYFFAIDRVDLATATALCYSYPLFATIFSAVLIGERVTPGRIFFIVVAWLGVLLLSGARPAFGIGEAAGIVSGILAGVAIHSVRAVRKEGESLGPVLSYLLVISTVIALPPALAEFSTGRFGLGAPLALVTIAASAMVGQVGLTISYRFLPTQVASPISLLVVPASTLGAWAIFGEIPSRGALAGMAVLLIGLLGIGLSSGEPQESRP